MEKDVYRFYRDRPEWSDVQPIPQDDGEKPVVQIAYTERFSDVYDYLRAVMRSGEMSKRALHLTADAIDCNPANYTVWHYRRKLLQHLNCDLCKELSFVTDIIIDEPKNYQVWYHRQKIVEWLGDPSQERILTGNVLEDDGKNYHAWQHRQWAITTFDLWERELEFVDYLLKKDLRNNSAWNQRYFVINSTTGWTDKVVKEEMQYAIKFIRKAPNNESSWNYLRGVLKDKRLCEQQPVRELCDSLLSQHTPSPHLLAILVDMYEEEAADGNMESLARAKELCIQLAGKVDRIREQYWEYTYRRLDIAYGGTESEATPSTGSAEEMNPTTGGEEGTTPTTSSGGETNPATSSA